LTTITAPNRLAARRRPRDARPFADGYVGRAELMARVLDARSARLVLVVAPAGYGKSTLLAEWASCDPRRFVPIAPRNGDDVEVVVESALQDAARS
jgi:LuxR family maltose regulon positive regulatory protein